MIASMTAFARSTETAAWGTVTCELRSVNHRFLELGLRLPDSLRHIEPQVREHLRQRLDRGKVDVQLRLDPNPGAQGTHLDRDALVHLLAVLEQVRRDAPDIGHANPLDILRWPGILAEGEVPEDERGATALAALDTALDALDEARHSEGARLEQLMRARLTDIAAITTEVAAVAPRIAGLQRQRITERVAELFADDQRLDPGRLEQEVALAAQKADIAEEVDRLQVHLDEVAGILDAGGACGRRLDFLMQELNREANTLAAKSVVTDTARRAVDLKVLIEQIREQVQNVA